MDPITGGIAITTGAKVAAGTVVTGVIGLAAYLYSDNSSLRETIRKQMEEISRLNMEMTASIVVSILLAGTLMVIVGCYCKTPIMKTVKRVKQCAKARLG